MTDAVGVWIAIVAVGITSMGTAYGVYREWQQRRMNQVTRLNEVANIAVRRTEASVVKPILLGRLLLTLEQFTSAHSQETDHLQFRAQLFGELHRAVRLTADEKMHARLNAKNHLVGLLKTMPNPPLVVHSEKQELQHEGRMMELIETAYGLRVRPSTDLMQQLSMFCRGESAVDVTTRAQARARH